MASLAVLTSHTRAEVRASRFGRGGLACFGLAGRQRALSGVAALLDWVTWWWWRVAAGFFIFVRVVDVVDVVGGWGEGRKDCMYVSKRNRRGVGCGGGGD